MTCISASTVRQSLMGDFSSSMSGAVQISIYGKVKLNVDFFISKISDEHVRAYD